MKHMQEEFKDQFDGLELTIGGFHSYQNIDEHEKMATIVEEVNNNILTYQD